MWGREAEWGGVRCGAWWGTEVRAGLVDVERHFYPSSVVMCLCNLTNRILHILPHRANRMGVLSLWINFHSKLIQHLCAEIFLSRVRARWSRQRLHYRPVEYIRC